MDVEEPHWGGRKAGFSERGAVGLDPVVDRFCH